MKIQPDFRELSCSECTQGAGLEFDFSMALQPIVNATTRTVFAQEALVRGLNNESAAKVFNHVNDTNRYRFDQACRVKAIKLASELEIDSLLSINFMPRAVYRPELCIRATLKAAKEYGFPIERIIFEVTEGEKVDDYDHLRSIVDHYKQRGFLTAIDDFGAGYSGLNLLAEMQTNLIKLDMALVRNVHQDRVRQSIIKGILQVCRDLDIEVIAEGIETAEEFETLQSFGIELFQGFFFAEPAFESLASISWR
ncbi:EAL domain-containing protein [Thiomicrorhabdus sp.]|jgi:EAL domain-containing protein (putative c-di-GMP-specific phosphodiesterase class I)|uniref:EAL domain-containing protein n=1 Tax=Thiomicrorhabdus sp. TaxID=2039724 RepID=UPI0035612C8A